MHDSDDFDIELGASTRRDAERKDSPLEDGNMCAVPFDRPGADPIPVFVSESVVRAIQAQAASAKEREVGGVLLGGFYRGEKSSYVEVSDFIQARSARSTGVSLTFTHEAWEEINAEQAGRADGARIIGWYHSHPGLGVFMSREDEFIHSSYFADHSHVALVVDPIHHDWGCFKWTEGSLKRTGGFYVFGEKRNAKRTRELVRAVSASRRDTSDVTRAAPIRAFGGTRMAPLVWAVVALVILWQIVIGYLTFSRGNGLPEGPDNYTTAMKLLAASDLIGGAEYLRQELVKNPHNDDAYRELDRLHNILADPLFIAADDERLDEINLMLVMADDMARGQARYRERSDFEGILPKSEGEGDTTVEETPPSAKAFKVYSQLADSHAARLERARLVQRIAQSLYPPPARQTEASRKREESAWYNDAVRWLEEEELRRTAYGLHAGNRKAVEAFENMTDAQRRSVKQIRAELVDSR